MKLQDIELNNWGRFEASPGVFSVTEYNLPRPWGYIYTTDDILLRIAHNGCGYAQVDPPGGIMLFKQERYEKTPAFFVWFCGQDGAAFSNFFRPHTLPVEAEPDNFRCAFRPEYAEYVVEYDGWQVETELSIAVENPAVIMRVRVVNNGVRRELSVCPVWRPHNTKADLALWDVPELYQSCKFFNNHGTGIMVETRDPEGHQENRKYTVMMTDIRPDDVELRCDEFTGNGSFERPSALARDNWHIRNDSPYRLEDFRGEDAVISQLPIAAMRRNNIVFEPGEAFEFSVVLHHLDVTDIEELSSAVERSSVGMLKADYWKKTVEARKRFFNDWFGRYNVTTPDEALNRYINEWLNLQLYWVSKLDRGWPTGMRGTRDAAQDYSGISFLMPEAGRKMLEEMFACQRSDGSFPRQFSASGPEGRHDLRDYVDSGIWVFELFYDYLRLSGDEEFIGRELRWLDSTECGTVEEHVKRLIEYYLAAENRGIHGLVKLRGGDWNDSLNNGGLLGRGESVMVSCQVVWLLKIAEKIFSNHKALCARYSNEADKLRRRIRQHALNNAGFLNGIYTDCGDWIFSNQDPDGTERINSPVNSFGLIAGIFNPEEVPRLLEKIDGLKGPNGYRLFYPPLGASPVKMAGRMGSGDLYAGNAENGTVYNHGSQGFLLRAITMIGDGNRALDVLNKIFSYDQQQHSVEICKTEPYGVLNCWNEIQGRQGEGEKTFLSGTISTAFRAFYCGMVGINPGFGGLSIEPCLPDAWNDVSCSCVLRSCRVNIKIRRCRGNEIPDISFNGMAVESFPVPWSKFDRDGVNHLDIRI